jgi:siroheme synthase-like protein
VVVGGGAIAQRKVSGLVRCGARVVVVSPTMTRPLAAAVSRGAVRHVARSFRAADLEGAWLAVAATDDPRVNERVFRAARRRRIFVNVVDRPRWCTFIAPATLRRGALTVAISTGGKSPGLAKRLRRTFERAIPPSTPAMLTLLGRMRPAAQRRLPMVNDRKRYFESLLNGRARRFLERGRRDEAYRHALSLLDHYARADKRVIE